MNIKKIAFTIALNITASTSAFAMESIYDEAKHVEGKTYYILIDEAAKAQLSNENYERFMKFVSAFPTTDLDYYNLPQETKCSEPQEDEHPLLPASLLKTLSHPQYHNREFFTENVSTVEDYIFPINIAMTQKGIDILNEVDNKRSPRGLAWQDLNHALRNIVQGISRQIVGSST